MQRHSNTRPSPLPRNVSSIQRDPQEHLRLQKAKPSHGDGFEIPAELSIKSVEILHFLFDALRKHVRRY